MREAGHPMVLRLEANMLNQDYREVKKQAELYLVFSADPDYVPRVHVLAGEACLELGLREEARRHWKAVLEDWKESPAVTDAEDGLYRLEH
jgi:predicted negative regulator of RcsB-dependent stress response